MLQRLHVDNVYDIPQTHIYKQYLTATKPLQYTAQRFSQLQNWRMSCDYLKMTAVDSINFRYPEKFVVRFTLSY